MPRCTCRICPGLRNVFALLRQSYWDKLHRGGSVGRSDGRTDRHFPGGVFDAFIWHVVFLVSFKRHNFNYKAVKYYVLNVIFRICCANNTRSDFLIITYINRLIRYAQCYKLSLFYMKILASVTSVFQTKEDDCNPIWQGIVFIFDKTRALLMFISKLCFVQ